MRELLGPLAVLAMAASVYSLTECPAAGQSNEDVLIPHEHDCAKFYKCVGGEKKLQVCMEYSGNRRLYFNPEKQVCDWPWNVTCTQRKPTCPTEGDTETTFSHPYDCSLYYRCINGVQTIGHCPEGQHFDSVQMACVDKGQASCYLYWDACPPSNFIVDARFPHESSCNKYYRCRDGKMLAKQCPVGYSFDVDLRKCMPADEAKCDLASIPVISHDCPSSGVQNIPHESKCGFYYECRDGVKTKKECKGGLSFDPVSSMCDWPPNSMCCSEWDFKCPEDNSGKIVRFPHECFCNQYYECINGHMMRRVCENGTEYDYLREVCDVSERVTCFGHSPKIDEVADKEAQCPETGNKLIPHESDCNLFYRCVNGNKQLNKCLEGHAFNEVLEACDLQGNTKCVNKVTTTTTATTTTTQGNGDFDCPLCNCDCIIRFPDKWNCSKYYQCDNGTKTSKECPDGLEYNPDEQICDWPDNVNCTVLDDVCETGNTTHHECRCNKYYECIGMDWMVKECPPGKLYDFYKDECVPDDEAICYPPPPTTTPEPPTTPIPIPDGCIGECPPDSVAHIPHEDCTKYCECTDGTAIIVNCTKDMYYNPDKGICDWPENIRNLTCNPFPCPSNSTDKVPHECTCDIYYVCKNGSLLRKDCPPDTEFNYEMGECLNPEISHCYKEPKPTDVTLDSELCIGNCPKLDPTDRSWKLPHKNCTKFCRCGAGAPYVVHCKDGLHYSPQDGICMEPGKANCNGDIVSESERPYWTKNVRKRSIWENLLPSYFH